MAEPVKKRSSYEDLYRIPENMIGEIVDGEIILTPRPSRRHVYAASVLGNEIGPPYHFGRGGPGGWVILVEPEVALDEHILVPDLAGWKKERLMTGLPEANWIPVSPDWVCEILSPSTLRTDKTRKMPIYAQHGVPYLWLIDPLAKTLDIFKLESGKWVVVGSYLEDDKVRAEPFPEVEIELKNLWWE
jgi:Uma2 family endonuclease